VKTHREVRDLLAHELESELLRLAQPQLGPALPSIVGVASRVGSRSAEPWIASDP
jgi:hypothetical protein